MISVLNSLPLHCEVGRRIAASALPSASQIPGRWPKVPGFCDREMKQ